MNIQQFWSDVLAQRADEIREYFHADAFVNWHCSNEHFTVEEFIRANCEYPGGGPKGNTVRESKGGKITCWC